MLSARKSIINGIIYKFGVTSCPRLSPSTWFMISGEAWINVSLGLIQNPSMLMEPGLNQLVCACMCVSVIARWNSKFDE